MGYQVTGATVLTLLFYLVKSANCKSHCEHSPSLWRSIECCEEHADFRKVGAAKSISKPWGTTWSSVIWMAGRIVCQVHRFPRFDSVHTESLWSILRIYRILKHIVRVIKQIFYEKKKEKEEILAGEDFPSRLLWRTPFKIHDAIVCDMCYHVRKMNYFPRKGQFN